MEERINQSLKARLFVGLLLIIIGLVMFPAMVSFILSGNSNYGHAAAAQPQTGIILSDASDNPNVVASSLATMADATGQAISIVAYKMADGAKSTVATISEGSQSVISGAAHGGLFVARGVQKSASFLAGVTAETIVYIGHVPARSANVIARLPGLNSVIRPADNTELPVIDSQLADLYQGKNAPASRQSLAMAAISQTGQKTVWPIHGTVTTEFGAPDLPYQVTHTGLDISSGYPSGIIPIKPFKAGIVIDVVRSYVGLGNHLVIDHGNGVTSVYGHLYSISVKVGQKVGFKTTLGYEGSTGASTGTHLHFEIRVDGQPKTPQQFIEGLP